MWRAGWPFGSAIKLMRLTGQRRSEVAEMRWQEIDLDAKIWTLPRERVKNDQAHTLPLSDPAIAILTSLPRVAGEGGYVFTTNGEAPISRFAKAEERLYAALSADLPSWTLHDLRRTFASGAARRGINLPVIEKIPNHVSGSIGGIVGVYQRHSFADEKRAALEAWGRFVESLICGEPGGNVVPLKWP